MSTEGQCGAYYTSDVKLGRLSENKMDKDRDSGTNRDLVVLLLVAFPAIRSQCLSDPNDPCSNV